MYYSTIPKCDDSYFIAKEEGKCAVCGKPTHRVEMNYETYICSDECEEKFIEGLGKENMECECVMYSKDNKAMAILKDYICSRGSKTVPEFDIFIVWKAKILQNWKYVLATNLPDNNYYELTYNGDKDEWYLDAYIKYENVVIPNEG